MEEALQHILLQYPVLAPALFVFARIFPIIIPPIPGIAVDAVGIFVFGWGLGFILGEIGILLGAMLAFWIGRFFREPAVRRFATLQKIERWEDQYSDRQTFWALVSMRFFTSPFFDYVSYAAGLTKINGWTFFLSTFLGTLPFMLAVYYFGGVAFTGGPFIAIGFFGALAVILYLLKQNTEKEKTAQ